MSAITQSQSDPDRSAAPKCSTLLSLEHRLRRSSYIALPQVGSEFQTDRGILHLRGLLPSYSLKQLAQELVRDLDGVLIANNQIEVARPPTNKG
jgi:osmotically-inducible protein OsmY